MRLKLFVLTLFLGVTCSWAQPVQKVYEHNLNYFIPDRFVNPDGSGLAIGKEFNPNIPLPKDILGYEVGQQYVDWNDILKYMYALDKASDRVSVKEYGRTYQNRPFIQVIITSESNQKNIAQIKEEHLKLTDHSKSGSLDISGMPVIVNLLNSIHGNEASGVNSTLVTAYFFAASLDKNVVQMLDNTVIVLSPGLNPDGINRFASWVNTTHSYNDVSDLSTREFSEAWPSSRTNHYWVDCNRDWLMCQHPEGQTSVSMFLEWMPNVVSDHHEMGGTIKGFYFSPGHPKRTHKYIPQKNQDYTYEITKHTAAALDDIGSLYFSKEGYDDFYLGKGAAYGDIHGAVGMLYEQVASRGYARPLPVGTLTFPFTVRNQVYAAFMTVYAASKNKDNLLEYQRDFYKDVKSQWEKDKLKGYVFNTKGRKAIEYHFLKNMQHHQIDVYKLKKGVSYGNKSFGSEDSYIIPLQQKSYLKIKAMWENMTEYADSVFYDISTWTFPHAYNLEYAGLNTIDGLIGNKVTDIEFTQGKVIGGKAKYAYVFENKELYSHSLLSDLLKRGLLVRIAKKPFKYKDGLQVKEFGYGTAVVQLQNQPLDEDELYSLLSESAKRCGVDVYALNTGLMEDKDLGNSSNKAIENPRVALITGSGMGIPESGEIWFMLDRRFGIPPALIDFNALHKADLNKYNVIIMADGAPSVPVSEKVYPMLKDWVNGGGVLILTGSSYQLASKIGVANYKKLPLLQGKKDNTPYKPYSSPASVANNVDGIILKCNIDTTSPLGYGYTSSDVAVMKNSTIAFDVEETKGKFPMYYEKEPYLSGYISDAGVKRFAYTPACVVSDSGSGKVICFVDDLNFRSYWFGTTKIFMNAIFFGQLY